jgi:hypothetical protein
MNSLSRSRTRIVAGALATAAVAMAITASTAAASVVPATWTTTGAVEFKGTLNLTRNGLQPKTCTFAHTGTALNESGKGLLTGSSLVLRGYCGESPEIEMMMYQNPAEWDSASGYLLRFPTVIEWKSPYGWYTTKSIHGSVHELLRRNQVNDQI